MIDISEFPRYFDIHGMVEILVDNLGPWMNFVGSLEESAKTVSATADGQESCSPKWLYRGQADASWPIRSSFEREYLDWFAQFNDPGRVAKAHELSMIDRFSQKACGYVDRPDMPRLEWLSLMRHYGVPTRLVDFTESPFVSLYFASQCSGVASDAEFAVWAVKRENSGNCYSEQKRAESQAYVNRIAGRYPKEELNRIINDRNSEDPDVRSFHRCSDLSSSSAFNLSQVITSNRKGAEAVLARDDETGVERVVQSQMLVVYPQVLNSRMRAQAGLFLMPTRLSQPFMDSLSAWCHCSSGANARRLTIEEALDKDMMYALTNQCSLIKFVFSTDNLKDVKAVLSMANINESTISPDLEGVASFVQKEYSCKNRIVYRNPISVSVS